MAQSPLKLQVIDWDSRDETIEDEDEYDSEEDNSQNGKKELKHKWQFVIRMFGIDETGQSIHVRVDNFTPYFFFRVPNEWNETQVQKFINHIEKSLHETQVLGKFGHKLMKKKIFWGFRNHKKYNVVQIRFKSMVAMRAYLRILNEFKLSENQTYESKLESIQRDIQKERNKDKRDKLINISSCLRNLQYVMPSTMIQRFLKKFDIFESNIDPMIRFIHIREILPSGWVQVAKYSKNYESKTKLDVKCHWENVTGLQDTSMGKIKEAMFDLEVNSSHGDFPVAKKDYQIFWNQLLTQMVYQLKYKKNFFSEEKIASILQGCFRGENYDDIFSIYTKENQQVSDEKVTKVIHTIYGYILQIIQLKVRKALEDDPDLKSVQMTIQEKLIDYRDILINIKETELNKQRWILSRKKMTQERRDKELQKWIDERLEELITEKIVKVMNEEFPGIKGDEIIQIGTTLKRYGEDGCYRKVLISLNTCNSIENVEVIQCRTEKEVLMKWKRLIDEEDPDIIGGYNIFGFDMKYLYHRAQELQCETEFMQLGRLKSKKSEFVVKKLSSSGLGDNVLEYITMDGRVPLDLMKVAQRDFKLDSYKLDFVSSTFMKGDMKEYKVENGQTAITTPSTKGLSVGNYITISMNNGLYDDKLENSRKYKIVKIEDGDKKKIWIDSPIQVPVDFYKLSWCESKDDVSPKEMFQLYRGSADDRAIIGKYCIQDCELCNRLMTKLEIIVNNMGMSNVCFVPFSYLFMRGQGVKIFSLISKYCRLEEFVMPVIKKEFKELGEDENGDEIEAEGDDSFQGAFVLDPIVGIYTDEPVAVNDFNSLYPSCMISHNLSHDSVILKEKYLGDEGLKKLEDLGYTVEDVKYDIFKGEGDKKEKIGEEISRYVQFANNEKGVIPKILMKLLQARKDTRKIQANEKDPFKWAILEGLQLAYKVTANSLYGQVGASTSPVCMKRLAASTTAVGRYNLIFAKEYVEKNYPGSVAVYGDTDSIFFKFKIPDGIKGEDAIRYCMEQSIKAGNEVSALLKRPHNWDFEKVILPFVLLSKKRYVGKYYMGVDDNDKLLKPSVKSMGIVLKRRDNAPIVKVVYGGVIDRLMKGGTIEDAVTFVKDICQDIINGKYPIEKFIISKTLKANYKNPDSISHKALAMRMGERNPGNKPQVNDRIPFVYVPVDAKNKKKVLQSDKIEHPDYVKEKNISIDYMFYITNQIMNPVTQIFEIKYGEKAEDILFGDLLRKDKNKKAGIKEITNFFTIVSKEKGQQAMQDDLNLLVSEAKKDPLIAIEKPEKKVTKKKIIIKEEVEDKPLDISLPTKQYKDMNKNELIDECKKRKLPYSNKNKDQLIKLLENPK